MPLLEPYVALTPGPLPAKTAPNGQKISWSHTDNIYIYPPPPKKKEKSSVQMTLSLRSFLHSAPTFPRPPIVTRKCRLPLLATSLTAHMCAPVAGRVGGFSMAELTIRRYRTGGNLQSKLYNFFCFLIFPSSFMAGDANLRRATERVCWAYHTTSTAAKNSKHL